MTLVSSGRPQDVGANRRGMLAHGLQEALTITARLRSNARVANDGDTFRTHVKRLLAVADDESRRAGYDGGDVRMGVYAVTVLVDESVLNSDQSMFANWSRQPLQEEIFGEHTGGERFFQNLRELLGRPESADLADLLEVHQLCLLLGFKGRYSMSDPGQLTAIMAAVAEKIQRIRGVPGPLSPAGALPSKEQVPASRDPWVRRLTWALLGAGLLAVVLFLLFRLSLHSRIGDLETVSTQLAR